MPGSPCKNGGYPEDFSRFSSRELLAKDECWEALFSLHPLVQHRLEQLLVYGLCSPKPRPEQEEGAVEIETTKERILLAVKKSTKKKPGGMRSFKYLVELAFLSGPLGVEI